MTSKQRAYLKGLAMTMDPILQLGKGGLTPENTAAVEEALAARELIKISVLQNCLEDPREMAQVLAERTRSQVVQVIGKKIVLYREGKKDKKKIILPSMVPVYHSCDTVLPVHNYVSGSLSFPDFPACFFQNPWQLQNPEGMAVRSF